MKVTSKIFILFLVINSFTWIVPQKAAAQVSVDFQIFYDDLSPYGTWVDNSDYGYVWVPNVGAGFTPYSTNGYWVFTDAGWTWVSNYPWGWAPFHYGRWYNDPLYGSVWVPGNEWGPGWVTWRRSDDYYGWAPIGPGISIDIAYSSGYSLPYNQWTFVRNRDFGRTNITNYYLRSSNNTTIINHSTVINNIHADRSNNAIRYNGGPDRTEVQKRAGKTFNPVVLKERNKPGQSLSKGQLQIYRPRVENNNAAGRKPTPSKVMNWKDIKPAGQRNTKPQPQKENQPTRQQGNSLPVKQQPSQPRRIDQPTKQPPIQPSHNNQGIKQQVQPPRTNQPTRQQPVQHPRVDQPIKQRPPQQPRNNQPVRQQPVQPQHNQPVRQQPPQQPRTNQPVRQQPVQPQHNQPVRQQPPQQPQHNQPPVRQQPQPQQNNQPKNNKQNTLAA